jgi:hypothetical protein
VNALLALAILVQAPASDTLQVREGLYVGFAIGGAMAGVSCEECSSGMGSQFSGYAGAGLGVALSPHLTVGFQLESWKQQESDAGFWASSAVVTWYPAVASGIFIRPTLGVASFNGDEIIDGPTEEGSGLVAGLTLGHDLRFDRKLSFTPAVVFRYTDIGNTAQAGLPYRTDLSAWMVGLGIGLTWH